jgi:hypothetical protein
MSGSPAAKQNSRRTKMITNFQNLGRNMVALMAALLIGTTFVAAATGPAMVTPTTNSDIVA